MKLIRAVSCWANEAPPMEALDLADGWGFEAVEGPFSGASSDFFKPTRDLGKEVFVEINTGCATGSYVPDPRLTPADHLEDFRRQLDAALAIDPLRITVLTGSDFWEFPKTCAFSQNLLGITGSRSANICVETHRSRPTFHPMRTARLLAEFPDLVLTLDVSHWCVVCERGISHLTDWLKPLEPRVGHIHARVGYDQGPQVLNFESPWHRDDFNGPIDCWKRIAAIHEESGLDFLTITPEFGPDGYLHVDPVTGAPLNNLRKLNRHMGDILTNQLDLTV
jgi:hypothetical protein